MDEPNITPWRRAVCGDLTSAFDFENTTDRVLPPLPSVAAYKPRDTVPPDFHPTPPAVGSVPTPYSYTVGAGDDLAAGLPNPGTYDLSLPSPNGFFRHFAGSPETTLRAEVHGDHDTGRLRLKLSGAEDHSRFGRHQEPLVVNVADAYGPDRHIRLHGTEELVVDTHHSGGWYDLALTTASDGSFSYQVAGRLESAGRLTSDPQLGRS